MNSIQSLSSMHAVVTGGGRGIGAAISRSLFRAGTRLTLLSRNLDVLKAHRDSLLAEAAQDGTSIPEVRCFACDVSDPAQVGSAFESARAELGDIEILVNNAGAVSSVPFEKLSLNAWDKTQAINLRSVFLCTQQVISHMKSKDFGRIINIASTAGVTGYPYVADYCAAKHGVIGLTRSLGLELATTGITVNAISPGYTDTDLIKNAAELVADKSGRSSEDIRTRFLRSVPQGRFVEPVEIASAVLWLCNPEQRSITAQNIIISGGEVV